MIKQRSIPLMFAIGVLIGLDRETTQAALADYVNAVNADASMTFLATNIAALPISANLGTLDGYNTYEFIANSTGDSSGSEALFASSYGLGGEAIKFDQWESSGEYGATLYFVEDDYFSTATTFGSDVFLDFVSDPDAGTTELFVNGVDTGSSVPFAVSLSDLVTIGASAKDTNLFTDNFEGTITAVAAYNSALSASEILDHYNAFIQQGSATPPTLSIAPSSDGITLFWAATGSYTLLQTTDLSSGVWTTNTSATLQNGSTNSVLISSPTGNMFFRLRNP